MAEMPSNIAPSAAQSGVQSQEIAKGRDAARANASNAATRQVKAAEEAGSSVDTDDADNRVFTDAEGSGSEGRAFEERTAEREQTDKPADNGITRGDDGRLHLDLEA
ncbi:MAG: hypothetical protein ACE5HE_09940 [Phycisphaerae bacterium]